MKKRKVLFASLLTVAMAMLLVVSVRAYTVSTIYYNYVGSSDAVAMQIVNNVNASRWRAEIRSYMTSPQVNINIIGRRSWTVREYCDLAWTQNYQYGGNYNTDTWNYSKTKTVIKEPCSGDRFGRSYGQHDFNDDGVSAWAPYLYTNYVFVP
jgi:hypothetical protein